VSSSTWRVTWLISRLAWRRLGNRFARSKQGAPKADARAATARKSAPGKLLLAFMAVIFAFQVVTVTTQLVSRAAQTVEAAEDPGSVFVRPEMLASLRAVARQGACDKAGPAGPRADAYEMLEDEARAPRDEVTRETRFRRLERQFELHCVEGFRASRVPTRFWPDDRLWHHGRGSLDLLKALALASSLLTLALALQMIAGAGNDLTQVDARLEFLFAFPIPGRALFLARIFALTLTSPTLWTIALPFYAVVFYCAGLGAFALLLGVLATLYVGLLASALRVLVEATLPRLLSPQAVARCQAALLVASYLSMVVAVGYSFRASQTGALERWLKLPDFVLYGPATAPLLIAAKGSHAAAGGLLAAVYAALFVFVAALVAEWGVRDGFVVSSNADQLTRGPGAKAPSSRLDWLRGGAAKEVKGILRDRQLRMQAFVTPVVLVTLQIWLNPSLLASVGSSPRTLAVAAFATSMFTLATGACGLLATEGAALWMLYTTPVPLERVLASKLKVWIGLALVFALAVLVGIWWREPSLVRPTLPYVPVLLIGIVIHAVIALGIGALGTDPLEPETRQRVRPGAVYLFMLLSALFGYALFTPSWWAKLVNVVLSALLAYALWQKLRDQLPYLLDPTEAPPPSLAVADGVLAAMGFFVLQGLLTVVFWQDGAQPRSVALAFAAAGATVSLLALWIFRRARLPNLRDELGLRRPLRARATLAALGVGVVAGVGAGTLALVYQRLVLPKLPFLSQDRAPLQDLFTSGDSASHLWLVLTLVLAAPLFEEFIFRGILFAGFHRSLGAPAAVLASSAVFALVHPAAGAPAVFVMAVLAAAVRARYRWLGAPIATHFAYNGVIVLAALG
jgi:ABC-2 type transport system permease protein